MKTWKFLFPLLGLVLLTGCQRSPAVDPEPTDQKSEFGSLFGTRETKISYASEMKKPNFNEIENKDEIQQEYFTKPWTRSYQLSQEEVNTLQSATDAGYCLEGIRLSPYENENNAIKIEPQDLKVGNTFQVSGNYRVSNLNPLTGEVLNQIKKYGFGIVPFAGIQALYPNYDDFDSLFDKEEWVKRIQSIGGDIEEYARAPFNTLLVTNDLLLHTFHKIFSNELQYFEEAQARPILVQLSETMFKKFQLGSSNVDQFLVAYWAIPHALLPSNEELKSVFEKRETTMRDNYSGQGEPQAEFSDIELQDYLTKRFEKILPQVAPKYQEVLKTTWTKIWEADSSETDVLLLAYSPDFILKNMIEQDYTQFRPRSHYTNSSFLKTYFMAMKWMMREKFYFGDPKLAETALYLVSSLPEQEEKNLNTLQDAILALIGGDDDATIQDIKTFITNHNLDTGSFQLSEQQLLELAELGKQRIVSTSYKTPAIGSTDEESAKDMTRGFVFFGEKFTLDSYIFDLLTAGSAEEEFLLKPNIQTALIVPDVLENYAPAHELVRLRLQEKEEKDQVLEDVNCEIGTCKQISSYPAEKIKAQEKIKAELQDENIMKTIYHSWLKMLGQLFVPVENAPYFKASPLYVFKNLVAYMGSYTELKHDTLLYVKQAYAELGFGGPDGCSIVVYPPALPVPKGYIEADVNFLDQLVALNAQTEGWFKDADTFKGFGEYLQKIRKLSLAQMQDQKISDEDFEWLRLSYDELGNLTTPRKIFGQTSSKLERGALIADIFTATGPNPLYEALGRPMLMALMVNDVNGARIVLGPVFSHYEFYQYDGVLEGDQRYTDEDWQREYDSFTKSEKEKMYGIENRKLLEGLEK